MACNCHRCIEERSSRDSNGAADVFMQMIVCERCGNKRCPHATDHRIACTNSNAPGQPGSIYE